MSHLCRGDKRSWARTQTRSSQFSAPSVGSRPWKCRKSRTDMTMITLMTMLTLASGENNLTWGRTAAAHWSFIGICQVAPMCSPCNARFLAPTQVSPRKRYLDRASSGLRWVLLVLQRIRPIQWGWEKEKSSLFWMWVLWLVQFRENH